MRNRVSNKWLALALVLLLAGAVLAPHSSAQPKGLEKVIFTVW